MAIQYKTNILDLLKQNGYNTNRLRKEKIMGESYIQQLRKGELVSWKIIDIICELTNAQPGDILEHIKE